MKSQFSHNTRSAKIIQKEINIVASNSEIIKLNEDYDVITMINVLNKKDDNETTEKELPTTYMHQHEEHNPNYNHLPYQSKQKK